MQKVKNFPQPVFLGLKFPQKGHKLKMQHFPKKTCNNHINNHILYGCLLDRSFPTRNMSNFPLGELFNGEIWQYPDGKMKNFPKFPQNMKISGTAGRTGRDFLQVCTTEAQLKYDLDKVSF